MSHHHSVRTVEALPAAVAALAVAAAFAVAGCAEPRTAPQGKGAVEFTWVDDVAPLFAERCTGCHSAAQANGDYRLDAYCEPALPATGTCAGVLGPGTDETANVVFGDDAANSRLLEIFRGDSPGAVQHRGYLAGDDGDARLAERLALLERWVVGDGAAYFLSSIHAPAVLAPGEPGFHGREIAARGWGMESCRTCHGDDYRGGPVEVSCNDCHRKTPEACDTCHGTGEHGAPPPGLDHDDPAGPHAAHLATTRFVPVECAECHHVPTSFDDPLHIGPAPDGRAELFFGPRASARSSLPAYDPETRSCANVACHGGGLTDGTMTAPLWALDTGLGCGSCHGVPPETLPNGGPHSLSPRCEECHPVVTGTPAPFPPPEPAAHGDGLVALLPRVTVPGCEGCHTGSPATVPPFRDLAGDTDPVDPQVGAHASHMVASFAYVGTDCAACHVMPSTLGDHEHVDAVTGAEVVFGEVARAGGLSPSFDSATRTCSNSWCHGAGTTGGNTVSPAWNTDVTITCSSCHANPPDIPPHRLPGGGLVTTCGGGCHGKVIDDDFNWTDKSLHVNGQVDLGEQG